MYLGFFLWYSILVPLQLYASTRQSHPVTRLFTASLLLEFFAFCFILIHVLKFALDGVGLSSLAVVGDILDILSRVNILFLAINIYFLNQRGEIKNFPCFSDHIHAPSFITCQRMGCHKIRINLEAISFFNLVHLWCSTHITICVEYGKWIKIEIFTISSSLSLNVKIFFFLFGGVSD